MCDVSKWWVPRQLVGLMRAMHASVGIKIIGDRTKKSARQRSLRIIYWEKINAESLTERDKEKERHFVYRVCVCEWAWERVWKKEKEPESLRQRKSLCHGVCVWKRESEREHKRKREMRRLAAERMKARERERVREREGERQRERERGKQNTLRESERRRGREIDRKVVWEHVHVRKLNLKNTEIVRKLRQRKRVKGR